MSDLAEVMSVQPAAPAPGPPKKTDDKSFFDVSYIICFTSVFCNCFDLSVAHESSHVQLLRCRRVFRTRMDRETASLFAVN